MPVLAAIPGFDGIAGLDLGGPGGGALLPITELGRLEDGEEEFDDPVLLWKDNGTADPFELPLRTAPSAAVGAAGGARR